MSGDSAVTSASQNRPISRLFSPIDIATVHFGRGEYGVANMAGALREESLTPKYQDQFGVGSMKS